MTETRWPELEQRLRARGVLQVLCLAAALALLVGFPRIESHPLQFAAIAAVGALGGVVVGGVLDVWFYVRPSPAKFERRDHEPAVVVGLVSQAAHVFLGVSLAVVAVGLAWQFGAEQMSLTKRGRGRGPFVPVSLVAIGFGALILWGRVSVWPGRRPELVITVRGLAELRTGTPFTVGWSAIKEVREENICASFWSRRRASNVIALETTHGTVLTLEAQHLKPNAWDTFEMLRALHASPALRARIGRVSSAVELLRPPEPNEAPHEVEELAFWQPGDGRSLIVGAAIAAIAIPLAIALARETPLLTERLADSDEMDTSGQNASSPGVAFTDELQMPTYDTAVTCHELREFEPLLTRLIDGLGPAGEHVPSNLAVPGAQQVLNAAGAMSSYARARLGGAAQEQWISSSDALAQGAQVIWYGEHSDSDASGVWSVLADTEPDLLPASRSARESIVAECA